MTTLSVHVPGSGTSLKSIYYRFKWRISITLFLVFIESLLGILYPLFIGWAINDLINNQYDGIFLLTYLGLSSLILGSIRRFYDTRVYSDIYKKITPEMIQRERSKGNTVSSISARTQLLTEFIEFFEDSMPGIIAAITGLIGILIIIYTLNHQVLLACLGLLLLMSFLYLITAKLNYVFNANFNDELEQQVKVISKNDVKFLNHHLKQLMTWNIKLSDLETLNYFFIWLGALALLIYTPITSVSNGIINYGLVLALLMYVYDYIEKITSLPLYIQQLIRLKEISERME